ncbi:hypothetical protein FKM82_029256 [Ascaphus truei]
MLLEHEYVTRGDGGGFRGGGSCSSGSGSAGGGCAQGVTTSPPPNLSPHPISHLSPLHRTIISFPHSLLLFQFQLQNPPFPLPCGGKIYTPNPNTLHVARCSYTEYAVLYKSDTDTL